VVEHPFGSPLLSGLDAHGRAAVRAAARLRTLADGAAAFVPGDPADTLWFVVDGSIVLETPRGAREIGESGHFGSEALARGASRATRALSRGESSCFEVPVAALERILAHAGRAALLVSEGDLARRQAYVAALLRTPFGQALGERALAELVGRLREESWPGGRRLFDSAEPAERALLVVGGLVKIVTSRDKVGFLARGDLVGLEATRGSGPYGATATTLGDAALLVLPRGEVNELFLRYPDALARAERSLSARLEKQARVEELSAGRATRHAVHELERLSNARSLLAIELDACVRCGECARACAETHGVPRLTRRGDKVALRVVDGGGFAARALLLPEACQHCRDPACLPACPTGAITRDATGAVALDEALCTGCGACAKACPWDAIRLAPRAAGVSAASELVAKKCDLCRGRAGPECVSACPTGAIFRADPARELVEVRSLVGAPEPADPAAARPSGMAGQSRTLRWLLSAALVPPLLALARRASDAGATNGRHALATGTVAALLALALLSHGALKRVPALRARLGGRTGERSQRGLARFVFAHALLGVTAAAVVLAHAGQRATHGVASLLHLVFWLLAASGGLGALCYRLVPPRLTRLERRGALPEDHTNELAELEQRLYGGLSEQDRAVKALARVVLLPYTSAWLGPVSLVLSGRTPTEEEARLALRIRRLLGGRTSERLSASETLVRAAVAFRVLAARRLLERALGLWPPLHLALAVLFALLLVAHVAGVSR
jgi:Fe-S-cluster-containing dehydrogenase component